MLLRLAPEHGRVQFVRVTIRTSGEPCRDSGLGMRLCGAQA